MAESTTDFQRTNEQHAARQQSANPSKCHRRPRPTGGLQGKAHRVLARVSLAV